MTHYTPRWFKPYELVPKSIYDRFADSSLQFLDQRILIAADKLRDIFGPVTCNNWHDGGPFDSRGLRLPSDTTGAPLSAHRHGKALDLAFMQVTPQEVRDWIRKNENDERIRHIARVELDTKTWVHIDCYNVERIVWVPLPK